MGNCCVAPEGACVPPAGAEPCASFKLLRQRRDGTIGPLFINRKQVIPLGVWLRAECHPTKGYALRPGWHVALAPHAPHLSMKDRVWMRVEVADFEELVRPKAQGGVWLIAKWMRVISALEEQTEDVRTSPLFSLAFAPGQYPELRPDPDAGRP